METVEKKYDLDRVVRLVITVVSIVSGVLVINYLTPVLWPFLLGFILAYILDPVVRFFKRILHVKSRILPVIITLLLLAAVTFFVLVKLIPSLFEELAGMTKMLSNYATATWDVPYFPDPLHEFIRNKIDVSSLSRLLTADQWGDLLKDVLTGTMDVFGGAMSVVWSIASSLIVLLYMVFVLLDFDKLSHSFKAAIPKRYRYMALRVVHDVTDTMSRYFRGQALVSLFVGIIFAIEFKIIGLPVAIGFGLFIGVLNLVPYLQLISLPIAAFLCLVSATTTGQNFWVLFGWTFGAYCLCQLIQDFILIPAIMKKQMGLKPAIVFLSLSLWGYILGFVGLIIALPLTTLIISYYNEFVLHTPRKHNSK